MSLADQYYLKAMRFYPYAPDEVMEALDYALGYDNEHAPALCLMGCLQGLYLRDYTHAKHNFEMALLADPMYPETYLNYAQLLLETGDLVKAGDVLDRGASVPGISLLFLFQIKAAVREQKGEIEEALITLGKAISYTKTSQELETCKGEIERLRIKRKYLKRTGRLVLT